MSAEPGGLLVYEAGGRWGWCYREGDAGFELHSNQDYDSREEAVVAARRAYPDVPFASPPG